MRGTGLTVLFRAAAGPRIGFGHLVRCRALARAMGVEPLVSLRGTSRTAEAARRLGATLIHDERRVLARATGPRVLVVDDPSVRHATAWVRRARRLGVPVATVHDLGLGFVRSDLAIDGSVRPHQAMRGGRGDLSGPAYAILDPRVERWRTRRDQIVEPGRVLIALGGGAHVLTQAAGLAAAIARRHPGLRIRVAAGFTHRERPALPVGEWVTVRDGLAEELARCCVALLAGGVSLYEACALGVPGVALAQTPAQTLTIRAIAAAGAVVDGGLVGRRNSDPSRVARLVGQLLTDGRACRRISAAGRVLVDGRGVHRVAARLTGLADQPAGGRHAA